MMTALAFNELKWTKFFEYKKMSSFLVLYRIAAIKNFIKLTGKSLRGSCFQNKKWLDSRWFPLSCKNVFRIAFLKNFSGQQNLLWTLSNIYDGAFCENSKRLKAVNYFCQKSFIIDLRMGSRYVSATLSKTFLFCKYL